MPRHRPHLSILAVLCATSLPMGLAHASAASAQAHIEQFSIELIDLDPNDGIIPSISFNGVTYVSRSGYGIDAGAELLYRDDISTLGATAVAGPAGSASTLSSASSWSAVSTLDGNPAGSPNVYADNSYRAFYTLSAATKAVFTIAGNTGADHPDPASYARANVSMGSQLSVWPYDPALPTSFLVYRDNDGANDVFSFSGEVHSGAEEAYGWLEVNASSFATLYGSPAPVPEPSTYAMLLAGAAIVGAARRRRPQH